MSLRLRRSGLVAGAIGGGAALAFLGAGMAFAQPAQEPISVVPTHGPNGAAFVVSGSNCDSISAQVIVTHNDDQVASGLSGVIIPPPVGDGSWSVTFNIDLSALEGETLGVSAICVAGTTTYAPATYTVDTTTTTTSSTTSTTSTTLPPSSSTTSPPGSSPGPGGGGGGGGGGQTTTTTAPSTTTPSTPPVQAVPPAPTPAEPNASG